MSKWLVLFLIIICGLYSCTINNQQTTSELIIFHAGSLSVPMKEIADKFQEENPKVKIYLESAGSVASARKITDLKKQCDILASADYSVIDNMLIPEYADWNIKFASNELSIVYTTTSRYASSINAENWYSILNREDVFYGRADPNSDPCGYRTVLMLQLAESYYNKPKLESQILSKNIQFIRPKEVDLIALLDNNSLDYIFLYKSVAIQHGLKYIELPDEINLSNPSLADIYAQATTTINGSIPGGKSIIKGEPMIYGITILRNAPNKEDAKKFLQFMLEKDKGMQIMEKSGQPSVIPMHNINKDKIPPELQMYVE